MQGQLLSHSEEGGAEMIAYQLLSGHYQEMSLPEGLVVSDVQNTVDIFRTEFGLLEDLDYFPGLTLESGEVIPLSVSVLLRDRRDRYSRSIRAELWPYSRRELLMRIEKAMSTAQVEFDAVTPIEPMSRNQAYSTVRERLTTFVSFRYESVKALLREGYSRSEDWLSIDVEQSRSGRTVNTPGCHFKAETRSSGLTVLWSPAFFVAPHYFGAPSTPVTKVVQAGIYKFGVSGSSGGSSWDHNAVVSVPDANSVYLQF